MTADFGSEPVLETGGVELNESDTVMRLLERHADIETRYGGGFVQAIEGRKGGSDEGVPRDWLYFVNGVEADRGAADYAVADGDRIWWDLRDWSATLTVPAVVGQFPEPFVNGYDGEGTPAAVECDGTPPPGASDAGDASEAKVRAEAVLTEACREVADRLRGAGAEVIEVEQEATPPEGVEAIRVLVAPLTDLLADPTAPPIDGGPAAAGIYAEVDEGGELHGLDSEGERAVALGPGTGLIAATRIGFGPPTWIVSGVDAAGVRAASRALEADILSLRYALAVAHGRHISLPVR